MGTEAVGRVRDVVGVTGASGFIGGRLVALLRRQPGRDPANIRAFSRRRNQLGCERLRLDDPAAVGRSIDGCRTLIHCAFDFDHPAVNRRIADVVADACAARQIRLVLISSASVYEPFPAGPVTEDSPSEPTGVPYSDTKIAIERAMLAAARSRALDVVILQPTVVYGPGCRQWTDTPARELLSGRVYLPDEGIGLCNAVHVDDVCRAAIAAMTAPVPSGERFIVSGPEPVRWGDFYGSLQAILGVGEIAWMPAAEAGSTGDNERGPVLAGGKAFARRVAGRFLGPEHRARLRIMLRRLQSGGGGIAYVPEGPKLTLYSSRGFAEIGKARRLLGWQPQIGFQEGMADTAAYLRSAFASDIATAMRRRAGAEVPDVTSSQPHKLFFRRAP